MKKILTFFIIGACFYSCSSRSSSNPNDSIGVDPSQAVVRRPDSVVAQQPEPQTAAPAADSTSNSTASTQNTASGKWEYTQEEDKMTSKTKYFASINANNLLYFPFPYDGGQTASLLIRNLDGKNGALLSVSKGQFISHVDDGSVDIRFDDAQPVTFSTSEPSDGSTDVLFIDNAAKLIKKLKSAKKVIIQAEFYESGLKTMEFDTQGFTWDH
ncbi:MAG TPA: hypothetical protein VHA56_05490 [Mucilaginibacter sp.]|nr:hypothetical protein [Mucilaginibacter sp.]